MTTKVKALDFDELLEGEKQREIAAIAKCKTVFDVEILMYNIEMIKQFPHTKEQGVEIDRTIAELKELCSKRIIELSSEEGKEIADVRKAFDLTGDLLCGNIEYLGIFLNAALKELTEAHSFVREGWREVNASLVLLEHAKKEFDGLETKFNELHHFLDQQALDRVTEEKKARVPSLLKLPPEIRRKAKKKIQEALHFIDSAEKKQRKIA